MDKRVHRLGKAPQPTLSDPHAQIKWAFFQVEAEQREVTAPNFRHAKNTYLRFISETNAYYDELKQNNRFYLDKYWEADALIRFNKWLNTQKLASKTRYSIYKNVRQVMDMAYALRTINTIVYHAPMFKGVSETKERAAYNKREQEVINAAIAKWIGLAVNIAGRYTPSGEGIPFRQKNIISTISIDDKSLSIEDAEAKYGISKVIISQRIRSGWTTRQAVGIDIKSNNLGIPNKIVVEDVPYESIAKVAIAYGVKRETVGARLRQGHTPEQAVGVFPIHVKQSDDRALLWMFENTYQCDAASMLEDFQAKRLSNVCSKKRMLSLFNRWGVWPYIDAWLIMPLAVEFAMLTGLNVESLKALELDSYIQEHPLTGQPAIVYMKPRSGSSNRSEERELHIPLLDAEELFLDDSTAVKIQNIVYIVKELTSKVRPDAPVELKNRLFIFEDVEQSKLKGSRVVVPIDPKGKATSWRARFAREEGLTKLFGDRFNFNIARCRPTLATNMVLGGADLFQVQAALGHKSVTTTATYLDELQLKPAFNISISEALQKISLRSQEANNIQDKSQPSHPNEPDLPIEFYETLSGCGCKNAYNPSENVKRATNFKEGSICKYWNMCLLCDNSVITQCTLPKLINYKARISQALTEASPAIRGRVRLFEDTIKLITGILLPGNIFPKNVIEHATIIAATQDDTLVDQLVYQGL